MLRLGVNDALREDLRRYLRRTFTTKADQDELKEFFDERVNPKLKHELAGQIFRRVLLDSKIFM